MIIRQEQMANFQDIADEKLASFIAQDLRANHPNVVRDFSSAELDTRIRIGIRRAIRHELTQKYTIALFVELMFLISPGFDRYPAVAFALRDAEGGPDSRFKQMLATMTPQQWRGARLRAKNEGDWSGL